MGNQARKQLPTLAALAEGQSRHSGGASEDWGRRGGTGGGPAPTDIEEPAGGVISEPTAVRPELGLGWPRSTLRWTGTTCQAASLDCSRGARREMPDKRGWIGLKAENHGGPGRAGP